MDSTDLLFIELFVELFMECISNSQLIHSARPTCRNHTGLWCRQLETATELDPNRIFELSIRSGASDLIGPTAADILSANIQRASNWRPIRTFRCRVVSSSIRMFGIRIALDC